MKDLFAFFDRYKCFSKARLATVAVAGMVFISGCANIWNASDLVVWVKDRVVEQGCKRETIELEEWYIDTAEGNVWRGTRQNTQGYEKSFGINVDPVWRPSQEKSEPVGPVIKSEKTEKLTQ